MDFNNLEIREKTFTREGVKKGQDFNFKYRKFNSKKSGVISQFQISNELFDKLKLDERGFIQINQRENPIDKKSKVVSVALALVAEDKAKIYRGKNNGAASKMPSFRSTVLEEDLAEAGIIDDSKIGVTQKLELVEETDVKNLPPYVFGVYAIVQASGVKEEVVEDSDESEEEDDLSSVAAEEADDTNAGSGEAVTDEW